MSSADIKEIRKSLKESKKILKEGEDLIKSGAASLKAEDIYLPLNHLFTAATKKAFQQKATEIPHKRKSEIISTITEVIHEDPVTFFGCQAIGERNIFDAAKEVAFAVNECAKEGWVTAALTKLMLIQLCTEPHELEKYLVISYIAMTEQGYDKMKTRNFKQEFAMGGIPEATVK